MTRAVVVGAGSSSSVEELVRTLPERLGFAIVIACPGHDGLAERLAPQARQPVMLARGRVALEADHLYVLPADAEGSFQRGELLTFGASEPRAPIDRLLRSLADEHGQQGAAVILGGRGNDGVIGIKRLKEAGGLTVVQTPDGDQAELPRAVIATGMIDMVLNLPEIAPRLALLIRDQATGASSSDDAERRGHDTSSDALRDILALVRIRSGHDFSSYKRATLYRRVSRRMQVCQCDTIGAYHLYLREHPGELGHLLRDFLISVTNFFRDPAAFDVLATLVIPKLFAGKNHNDEVRIWVTGCATGEEAYSLGILLCEYAQTVSDAPQLQIFATDIDEDALTEARGGRYPATIAADVSAERLQRFFTQDGDQYRVSKELREVVLFSPHNVLRDPPFSRLDLISCRNLLIYLNRDAQDRVLNVFHFGLKPDGFLFLGSSESAESTQLFTGIDVKHRLFMRRPTTARLGGETLVMTGRNLPAMPASAPTPPVERASAGDLHHRLIEQYAPPSLLVSEELDIVHVSEHAGRFLQVAGGEPSHQLLRMIHPALRAELRTAIYAARQTRRGSDTRVVRFEDHGAPRAIEIRVRAMPPSEVGRGSLLVFLDEIDAAPSTHTLEQSPDTALEPVMRELEDELRRTREQLRTTIEQYETSLEELKASNEELQAINEELRSATEELETSKEELQSVNEELTTLNHELKLKVDEISHANSDLQNLMTSTDIGVVFLDRALNIKRFTPRAQDLFNMIPSDIGRPLGHLTHRLEADDLPQLAVGVLQTLRSVEREIRSRDGRRYLVRLLPYRSLEDRIDGVVLTFIEVTDLRDAIDARRRTEAQLQAFAARLELALRTAPMLVLSLDGRLHTTWGYVLGEELAPGSTKLDELLAASNTDQLVDIARRVLRTGIGQRAELDLVLNGERRTYDFGFERTQADSELGVEIVGFDITPAKHAQASLIEADRRKDEFLATLSHELRNPLTPLKVALDVAKLAGNDPDKLAASRGIMERQVAQLSQLVDDLLDLSRSTQGKIQIERVAIDAAAIVEAALEATRPLIDQRKHRVTVELPSPAVRVIGDHARLTQVLTNLLNNAAKYTPEGGNLQIVLETDLAHDLLRVRVRDDGDGIPADLLPSIFDIFVQCRDTDGRSQGGLGIGLNLVRRLVELHGGTVAAASPGAGQGSTFTVALPLARG